MSNGMETFSTPDWTVLGLYFLLLVLIGFLTSRNQRDAEGFFLGGRSMPTWAVALSVLATTLSAATFVSVPQLAYTGDLTYLVLNIGGLMAAFLVAGLFLPPLYRAGTITVYGFLDSRYGSSARIAASFMFLIGRLLASGARLFIAAVAFALILSGSTAARDLVTAIIIFGGFGLLYTAAGGIKAVIWTDVLQIGIVCLTAILSIYLLLRAIPLSGEEVYTALRDYRGQDKLKILDLRFDRDLSFTIWTGIIASTFVSTSAYSVDQDMVQRMLTTRSPREAGRSLIASILIGIPVVCLFLFIGLLLSIYYGRPDLMGAETPLDQLQDTKGLFPQFILNHLPVGLKGLAMAGLFAAAMSSYDSAVNAMASSALADLYEPWKRRFTSRGSKVDRFSSRSMQSTPSTNSSLGPSRLAVLLTGALLVSFAILAVYLQSLGNEALIDFALGVMAFANAPLLGVFSAAIFTRRGNARSVIASLLVGCALVLLLQPYTLARWLETTPIAWPWWWVIVSPTSFLICVAGKTD